MPQNALYFVTCRWWSCYWLGFCSVFLWPFFWHFQSLNLSERNTPFNFPAWATAEVKARPLPVIHLIVLRVNELVSLFRSISVHYSIFQSALKWLWVVLPPFLALSDFLTSLPFFPLVLVSWWKCNQRRTSEGMKLKFLSLQFFRRRQRKQGKKLGIDELRKCVIE